MPAKRKTRTGHALQAVPRSIQGERYGDLPTPQAEEWLSVKADSAVVVCHAERHDLPDLYKVLQGKKVRGFSMVPDQQIPGVFQLRETCARCGTVRVRETLRGGMWNTNAQYRYEYPPEYHQPKHGNLSKSDYKEELYRRLAEVRVVQGHIEAPELASIPAATFSG